MEKINTKEKDNLVLLSIDTKIYDLEVIYAASYNFLDKAYIILDGDPEKVVNVFLKGKEKLNNVELEKLGNLFFNELISSDIRMKISKKNKAIREYIVSSALLGASPVLRKKVEEECSDVKGEENSEEEGWDDDPLGIAVSWEAKYKKNEEKKKDD